MLSVTRIDKAYVAVMITFAFRRYRVLISTETLHIVTGDVRGFLHSFQKSAGHHPTFQILHNSLFAYHPLIDAT